MTERTVSRIFELLGGPRDFPPPFPLDVGRIQAVVARERGICLSDAEAQSFWEEASDPDGWVSPGGDAEIVEAFDRLVIEQANS